MPSLDVDRGSGGKPQEPKEVVPNTGDLINKLKVAPLSLTKGLLEALDRLSLLEEANQGLRLDLQDQTAGRKQWQERARKTEQRQTANPYLIAFIDGNYLCFRNRLVQAGRTGAEEAAKILTKEIREHAHEHHKNDLPRTIAVVVQIFLSIDQLAQDLLAVDAIKDGQELHVFLRNLASQPGVYVNDCRADAVQSRVQEAYELHLENCHCQHTVLALGANSEYYATLAEYADDEYTRLKTSLIRPGGGFPEDDLPFHLARFSDMHDVPLIPLVGETISELYPIPLHRVRRLGNRPSLKPESFTSAIMNHDPQLVTTAPGSDAVKSPNTASLGSDPLSQACRHEQLSSLEMSPQPSPVRNLNSPDPASPVEPRSSRKTLSQAGSGGASSRSSARSRRQAADSPSRQQDWEIDHQSSKLPDALPTNRVGIPQEVEREQGQSPAVLAIRHSNQLSKQSIDHRPLSKKPNTSGVRYRPGRHSPDRKVGPIYSGALPNVSGGPATVAVHWLPEIPVRNNIIRNRHGQRLDGPLPRLTGADFTAFKNRANANGPGFCNEHHLKGTCRYTRGAESGLGRPHACVYDHGPIDEKFLVVLMHFSRNQACHAKSDCRDFGCIFGHQCKHESHLHTTPNGRHRQCPWAAFAVEDTLPDPEQTIYCQPADTAAKTALREPEPEREDPALLLDPDV